MVERCWLSNYWGRWFWNVSLVCMGWSGWWSFFWRVKPYLRIAVDAYIFCHVLWVCMHSVLVHQMGERRAAKNKQNACDSLFHAVAFLGAMHQRRSQHVEKGMIPTNCRDWRLDPLFFFFRICMLLSFSFPTVAPCCIAISATFYADIWNSSIHKVSFLFLSIVLLVRTEEEGIMLFLTPYIRILKYGRCLATFLLQVRDRHVIVPIQPTGLHSSCLNRSLHPWPIARRDFGQWLENFSPCCDRITSSFGA